jgi:hypothetical protein
MPPRAGDTAARDGSAHSVTRQPLTNPDSSATAAPESRQHFRCFPTEIESPVPALFSNNPHEHPAGRVPKLVTAHPATPRSASLRRAVTPGVTVSRLHYRRLSERMGRTTNRGGDDVLYIPYHSADD